LEIAVGMIGKTEKTEKTLIVQQGNSSTQVVYLFRFRK